ncbi:MAG: hypothetical protein LBF16_11695, partial [Pseudomonadales bacterium]|nr:hypothetical protein [Pseudomonadales bacterium]
MLMADNGDAQACTAALAPHILRFATDDLPEKDRIPYWIEFFGRKVFGLNLVPLTSDVFSSTVILAGLPDLGL